MENMSQDEILSLIEDDYDASIAPKKIVRNDNSKMHLAFKADAKGYAVIQSAILTVKNRFDPSTCSDEDLVDTAKIVGTKPMSGKSSLLQITARNSNTVDTKQLTTGTYRYISSSGEPFQFSVALDTPIAAGGVLSFYASSVHVGSFKVTDNTGISVARTDGAAVDSDFLFSCIDNSGTLGRPEEDALSFRKRILAGTGRQDEVQQIEEAIKNLPDILECSCIFNQSTVATTYDGVPIGPYELLINITGVPSTKIAEIVARACVYKTCMIDSANVVHYENARYIGGKYPVYYRYHSKTDYSLNITYGYDSTRFTQVQVESRINEKLERYKLASTHVDTINEYDIYQTLSSIDTEGISVLNIDMTVGGVQVAYVSVPRSRIPRLVDIGYTPVAK